MAERMNKELTFKEMKTEIEEKLQQLFVGFESIHKVQIAMIEVTRQSIDSTKPTVLTKITILVK